PGTQGFPHGLHRWLPLPEGTDEAGLVATALSHQVAVAPGAGFAVRPRPPALRLSIGGAPMRDLGRALRSLSAILPR
ncbi:MAG: PLP-dependent aminotransferase family protein, partial [Paracoccus sp. (in: a-proteobacteria)]|nr:PLP-dependent aminotransferase family protein [Paracoccus sp. (in: a-proteobacteria)]